MRPPVLQLCGWSGSGKTTLAASIIRKAVANGRRVHAVKHTHHPIDGSSGGDTATLLEAGAAEAVLIGEAEAVRWRAESDAQPELLASFSLEEYLSSGADLIIIEGYKSRRLGDVVVTLGDGPHGRASVLLAHSGEVQEQAADAATLLAILDTIRLS